MISTPSSSVMSPSSTEIFTIWSNGFSVTGDLHSHCVVAVFDGKCFCLAILDHFRCRPDVVLKFVVVGVTDRDDVVFRFDQADFPHTSMVAHAEGPRFPGGLVGVGLFVEVEYVPHDADEPETFNGLEMFDQAVKVPDAHGVEVDVGGSGVDVESGGVAGGFFVELGAGGDGPGGSVLVVVHRYRVT